MPRLTPIVLNLILINALIWIVLNLYESQIGDYALYFRLFKSNFLGFRDYNDGYFRPVQIVTYMFNHGGIMHIFFNMLALASLGSSVEMVLGSKRFLRLYLFSGVFAGVCLAFLDPSSNPVVGASGAISGVFTVFALLFPRERLSMFPIPISFEASKFMLGYAVLSTILVLFAPNAGGISHFGHLAGMAGGLIIYELEKRMNL